MGILLFTAKSPTEVGLLEEELLFLSDLLRYVAHALSHTFERHPVRVTN